MATSFNGERSRSTRREPPTIGKQLVSFITCGCESSAPVYDEVRFVLDQLDMLLHSDFFSFVLFVAPRQPRSIVVDYFFI
jgi:hypothetical protein